MLRSRILSAATAAVLMLGMSVGGAGAAFAETDGASSVVDETLVTETSTEPTFDSAAAAVVEPASEPLFTPAARPDDVGGGPGGGGGGPADSPCNFEPGFGDGTKYNIPEDVAVSGSMVFEWGTLAWSQYQLVFTANPGWTVDLCVKGGSQEDNSIRLDTGSIVIDRVQSISHFMWANPSFIAPVASASIVTDPRDCFEPTSWNFDTDSISNATWGDPVIDEGNGTISITATATGGALFAEGLDGVSEDRTTRTFTEPYEEAGGEDCVAPSIDVVASFTQLTCDPDSGSFTVGLFDPTDPNADKLLWTTTSGTVPSATANTVSEPGVVTVTVRVANAHLGDFAVNETSSLGTVSTVSVDGIETALITWTFTFVESDDCELGSVVVPIVTYEDYCEGVGPNALRVATFTVTDVENASYTYTVNGGAPIAVDFGGEETVTIAVDPLDVVVVTATPADGFQLNDGYTPWTHTFLGAAFCPGTFPATVAAAEITPANCDGDPVVVTVTNEAGVIWTLNGNVVEGNSTHELAAGSPVVLTAALEGPSEEYPGGWTWSDPEQQTEWTADGVSDEDCLSSLALTGTNSATEWIGVAAVLMMIVGMGFVIRRRSVEI